MDVFETMAEYAYGQSLQHLTEEDFLVAMVLFAASLVIGTRICGKSKSWNRSKTISMSVLLPYIYLVLMFAVFRRDTRDHPAYELMPFWSYYQALFHGKRILLVACLLNILMFVPLGTCLAGLGLKLRHVIVAGVCMSYFIEVSQLISCKGLFELFDDPFHNILGTVIGYYLFVGAKLYIRAHSAV